MGKSKRGRSQTSDSARKSLDEPEKLSPIPGAAPPEEPQVDEVLPEEERRDYRKAQRERKGGLEVTSPWKQEGAER